MQSGLLGHALPLRIHVVGVAQAQLLLARELEELADRHHGTFVAGSRVQDDIGLFDVPHGDISVIQHLIVCRFDIVVPTKGLPIDVV
jgi:hypothetical protein